MNYVKEPPSSPNSSSKFPEVPRSSSSGQTTAQILSSNELAALIFIQERSDAAAPEIADVLGMARRRATKLLARLVDKGVLVIIGAGKVTRYRAAE